jgi:hypothetical protein
MDGGLWMEVYGWGPMDGGRCSVSAEGHGKQNQGSVQGQAGSVQVGSGACAAERPLRRAAPPSAAFGLIREGMRFVRRRCCNNSGSIAGWTETRSPLELLVC